MGNFKFCYVILLTLFLVACGAPEILEDEAEMVGYAVKEQGYVLVTTATRFKKSMGDVSSSAADPNSFCDIPDNSNLIAEVFYGNESDERHVKVKLLNAPAGCHFAVGYFYRDHVNIQKSQAEERANASADLAQTTGEEGGTLNKKLIQYYAQKTNYNMVFNNVAKGWFGTTENGCVAFASSALRLSQAADIPWGSVSINTRYFSSYLLEKLYWKKITSLNELRSGDVAFSLPAKTGQGPAHTYVFHSWQNKASYRAYVIDNQGFKYIRNMKKGGYTPFAYALRSPH